jgi:hypothetical protein
MIYIVLPHCDAYYDKNINDFCNYVPRYLLAIFDLGPKLITYLQPLIEVNPMSMSIHISIFYLRPYIKNHNSQSGYIIGTLKHKFGLKLR